MILAIDPVEEFAQGSNGKIRSPICDDITFTKSLPFLSKMNHTIILFCTTRFRIDFLIVSSIRIRIYSIVLKKDDNTYG